MQQAEFLAAAEKFFPVSHETVEKLNTYYELLVKWQKKINLISPSTVQFIWQRHMLDCWQLVPLIEEKFGKDVKILDMGSGAGFPALVLAITGFNVVAAESDQRKCSFLREVCVKTNTDMQIENKRVEEILPQSYGLITARAFASLTDILAYAEPHTKDGAQLLLLKGESVTQELTLASQLWHMEYSLMPSKTSTDAKILYIWSVDKK